MSKIKNRFPTRGLMEAISLYEFVATVGLAFLAASGLNLYAAMLLVFLVGKQIPERILKDLVFKKQPLNTRPTGAMDCNLINRGGDATSKPGFPSGHTTTASFLFFIQIFQFINTNKNGGLLTLSGIFAVLVPFARVALRCHTLPQVMGGFILGCLLALLFLVLENNVFINIPRYVEDKKKFYALFNV